MGRGTVCLFYDGLSRLHERPTSSSETKEIRGFQTVDRADASGEDLAAHLFEGLEVENAEAVGEPHQDQSLLVVGADEQDLGL